MNARSISTCLAAGLMVLALASTGCSRRSKAPDLARIDDEAIAAASAPVNILNRDLRKKVAADIVDAERLPDGRLRARVSLRNSTKKPLAVQARTVFKDELGISTGDETPWQPLFFAPQQSLGYAEVSREPTAQTFTVEVRQ
ncbi:MAG: YcfL family protein [Sumerlaeia bacterium]